MTHYCLNIKMVWLKPLTPILTLLTDFCLTDGYMGTESVIWLPYSLGCTGRGTGINSLASHDFARIPEISREYGVSIKYMPGETANSARQNLYITNNQDVPVTFVFEYDGTNLKVKVVKDL